MSVVEDTRIAKWRIALSEILGPGVEKLTAEQITKIVIENDLIITNGDLMSRPITDEKFNG